MDADQLRPKLLRNIAILPGSRDRDGGPIIIFPSQGEWVEFPYSDIVSILGYLSQIPEDKTRSRGFTVIIDMRHGWIKYLKTILKACQQALYGYIHQVLIVKPEQFLEIQKINLEILIEAYEFRALVLSIQKLSRHVDITQLPPFLGGTFPYENGKWLDLRSRYESFLRDCSGVLRKLKSDSSLDDSTKNGAVANGNLPSTSLDQSLDSYSSTIDARTIDDLLKRGEELLFDLRGAKTGEQSPNSSSSVGEVPNPDFLVAAQRVEILMRQIKDRQHRAETTATEHVKRQEKTQKVKSDANLYAQFLEGINNVSDWLLGPGEKWLLTLHEIGESKDEAEQLRREHDHLDAKSQEVIRQAIELKTVADKLIETGHPNSSDIRKRKDYLDSVSRAFSSRVRWQKEMIRYSCRFHRLVDEVSNKLDEMIESLCSEVLANDSTSAEANVKSIDAKMEAIEKSYHDLMASGQSFIDQLHIREQNTLGNEVVRDYSAGAVHVRQCLDAIHDRKQRCCELADVRKLKMQQLQQLFTCEKDADQAIKWIDELLQTLQSQQTKLGSSPEEMAVMKQEQVKMEQTARSTYDYGRQLVQVSLVLRRSLRMELGKQSQLARKLDETWARFCRALSDRTTSLNIGSAFYSTVREVNDKLEELCTQVGNEARSQKTTPTSTLERSSRRAELQLPPPKTPPSPTRSRSSTPAGGRGIAQMDRYDALRKHLASDVRELRHMAEALISRMEVPAKLYAKPEEHTATKSASSDIQAVKEIRDRISQIESKQQHLETHFSVDPMNVLVRD